MCKWAVNNRYPKMNKEKGIMNKSWAAIFITFSLFIITSASFAQQERVVDQVMAVVGNKIILQSDIEKQYGQYVQQSGGALKDDNIRCQIFSQLLLTKLLLNQCRGGQRDCNGQPGRRGAG